MESKKQFGSSIVKIITNVRLLVIVSLSGQLCAQAVLTSQQIARAEALGRRTNIPMKLGTLIKSDQERGFQAFITTPEQRIAYALADLTSYDHGSGVKDPLAGELHLNRLRVTGLPYPNTGSKQRNSRHVVLCKVTASECLKPVHEVLDVNQVVAEFDMPAVINISGAVRTFVVRIQNDGQEFEPDVKVPLASIVKRQ